MALTDRYGLPVTTSSSTAFDRFQEGVDDLLAYGPGAEERFAAALAADERLALAHVGQALLAAVQGDAAAARAATARARETVDGATRRERQHVEAVSAFVAGETARGLALVDEHVAEFPRDAMLVNQASSAIALAGRSDREEHRVAFLPSPRAGGGDWRSSRRSPSRITRWTASRSRAGCPWRRSISIPVTRARPTTWRTSPSRPSISRPVQHSSTTGWPATTGAPTSTVTSPGTRRCSRCTRAATRRRSSSSSATSCPRATRAPP